MSAKHTPGLWAIQEYKGSSAPTIFQHETCEPVAEVSNVGEDSDGSRDKDEELANARLIAAAPELLAAIQDMLNRVEWAQRPGQSVQAGILAGAEKLREAIAKAEGPQ